MNTLARRSALMAINTAVRRTATRGFASDNQLSLTFASPATALYRNAAVKQVDAPSYSGHMGILANHVPVLAVMKPGVVTVYEEDGAVKKYFVSAGTITINDDSTLQLLASEVAQVEDLDKGLAQENLNQANSRLSSASTPEDKAEALIAIEVNEAILKAGEA